MFLLLFLSFAAQATAQATAAEASQPPAKSLPGLKIPDEDIARAVPVQFPGLDGGAVDFPGLDVGMPGSYGDGIYGDGSYGDAEALTASRSLTAICPSSPYSAIMTLPVCRVCGANAALPGTVFCGTATRVAPGVYITVGHALHLGNNPGEAGWNTATDIDCTDAGSSVGRVPATLITVTQSWYDRSSSFGAFDGGFVVTAQDAGGDVMNAAELKNSFTEAGVEYCLDEFPFVTMGYPSGYGDIRGVPGMPFFPDAAGCSQLVSEGGVGQRRAEDDSTTCDEALEGKSYGRTDLSVCFGASGSPVVKYPTLVGILSAFENPEATCNSGFTKLVRSGSPNGDGDVPGMHVDAFKVHIGDVDFDNL